HELDELVAAPASGVGDPLALEPELGAALDPGRDVHVDPAVDGRDRELAAERRPGDRERDPGDQVLALAPQPVVLANVDRDPQVARIAAEPAGLTLPAQQLLGAALGPGRQPDLERSLLLEHPAAAAGRARILLDHPEPVAAAALAATAEQPAGLDLAAAVAVGAL